MKHNDKGSFTVEASILFSIIFLTIFFLFKAYLFQFAFYYGRSAIDMTSVANGSGDSGFFFTQYEREDTLSFMKKSRTIKNYDEKLNYLRLMHSYVLVDELGGKVFEELWTYKK